MQLQTYLTRLSELLKRYTGAQRIVAMRHLCRTDLFYLLRFAMNRPDMQRQWLFDRCREVQAQPNGMLDLWSREHYKSTIITFGKSVQDILASHGDDPLPAYGGREMCIGIFSHTRPNAKGFLRQIKYEFEANELLRELFPDILWDNPTRDAPKWSEDDGIIVKRKSNPKEATVEAWGLVDGQPTGKHFPIMDYDDIVTRESVTSPEMMKKTTEATELSYNLGTDGGVRRFIGTRYHYNDTYRTLIERGTVTPRIRLATHDGTIDGDLALWDRETLLAKRRDMGPYTFGAQIMQNPTADATNGFKREWMRFYNGSDGGGMTKYILVDAANEKRATNDYTAIWVVGLGEDRNRYVLDIVRDRLNLTERAAALFRLHRKWRPHQVRYERYGLQGDVQHIKAEQDRMNYRFEIIEVGGSTPKNDRIRRLVPSFERGEWYFPHTLNYTNYEGHTRCLVRDFIEEEYAPFPVGQHDDMLDALARIEEPELTLLWPMLIEDDKPERYKPSRPRASAWAN